MQLARGDTSSAGRHGMENVARTGKRQGDKIADINQRGNGNTANIQQADKINNVDGRRNIVSTVNNTRIGPQSTTNIVNGGGADGADPEPIPIPVPVSGGDQVIVDPIPWPVPTTEPVASAEPSPNDLIATGVTDYSQGNYQSAESRFQHALDILKGTEGSNPRLIANALENLANVYDKTRRTNEAELARERARSIRQIS